MYQWLVFLHIASVLAFMLVHGVQVTVIWKIRLDPDPARALAMLEALPDVAMLRASAAAIVVTGLLLVWLLGLWTSWWVWLSLALLVGIWLMMLRYGGAYIGPVDEAAAAAVEARGGPGEDEAAAAYARARTSALPAWMTVVGLGGVAVILWLMVFKPG